jgi:predicted 3-demethylubiquinone-9 3-methyltransferase (glyoxalase superfamily)
MTVQKITTFLWFHDQAEEAATFYTSIFRNSKILNVMRMGPGPEAKAMAVTFQLEGQEFQALNGGPQFTFTPAISLMVKCETQQEVDEYWNKLTAGGSEEPCGWLKDRYGLSWQVIPTALGKLLGDPDPTKAKRAMDAMLKMKKLDIAKLRSAHAGVM